MGDREQATPRIRPLELRREWAEWAAARSAELDAVAAGWEDQEPESVVVEFPVRQLMLDEGEAA